MKRETDSTNINRRDFLRGGSFATLMTMLGGVQIAAQSTQQTDASSLEDIEKVNCAVIGYGLWGREIAATLSRLPQAQIVTICDTYEPFLRRAIKAVPGAGREIDYRKVLDNPEIKAVLIATPSHLHREIAVAALQAGKHVYCEAPLATSIEDARAIAKAAKDAAQQYFQAGLLYRSDPQRHFMLPFIRAGAMGRNVMVRAQWHKKQSWRFTSPNPDREKETNWRLSQDTSIGLIGEYGMHQVDSAAWFLNARPLSVTGFGSVMHWADGRDVPDTIQALFEFPGGVNLMYHASLANSFDAEYEMYHGTEAAVLLRDGKAWMFKEADAPLLGWEVYAQKDSFYKETGISLRADATKQAAQAAAAAGAIEGPSYLQSALEAFLHNTADTDMAVEDFKAGYDISDVTALQEYLAGLKKAPAAGYQEGLEAAIIAIKANDAILQGTKINLSSDLFTPV
jgi:predicted dehydrogenase